MSTKKELAEQIVAKLKADFTDRRGFRQEWDQVDTDVREEMNATWMSIVEKILGEGPESKPLVLSADKVYEFGEASRPLMKWLAENCHPHTTVLVDSVRSQLVEGVCSHRTEEFLVD